MPTLLLCIRIIQTFQFFKRQNKDLAPTKADRVKIIIVHQNHINVSFCQAIFLSRLLLLEYTNNKNVALFFLVEIIIVGWFTFLLFDDKIVVRE